MTGLRGTSSQAPCPGLGPAEERTPFSHVPRSCTVPKVDVTRMCMNSDLSTTLHHILSHDKSLRVAVSEAMGRLTMARTRLDALGVRLSCLKL